LKFPLSNCACFSPEKNKVVLFGGGFSSGFSPYVEQIDVESQKVEKLTYFKRQWTPLNDYPIGDNLDSWSCALTFIPKELNPVRN
jgi:hypothetical protein